MYRDHLDERILLWKHHFFYQFVTLSQNLSAEKQKNCKGIVNTASYVSGGAIWGTSQIFIKKNWKHFLSMSFFEQFSSQSFRQGCKGCILRDQWIKYVEKKFLFYRFRDIKKLNLNLWKKFPESRRKLQSTCRDEPNKENFQLGNLSRLLSKSFL